MRVDLALTVDGTAVPFPTPPGPTSNGAPVLIRNRNFDANPDINQPNAPGKGWGLERSGLPKGTEGFPMGGDRTRPVYYLSDGSTLYAEPTGAWPRLRQTLVTSRI